MKSQVSPSSVYWSSALLLAEVGLDRVPLEHDALAADPLRRRAGLLPLEAAIS
jgi:hypothetical protein